MTKNTKTNIPANGTEHKKSAKNKKRQPLFTKQLSHIY